VSDVRVVDSRRTRIALAAEGPRLTLVTCYPFDAVVPGGPLRWVVTVDLDLQQATSTLAMRSFQTT
jgi:sortase A